MLEMLLFCLLQQRVYINDYQDFFFCFHLNFCYYLYNFIVFSWLCCCLAPVSICSFILYYFGSCAILVPFVVFLPDSDPHRQIHSYSLSCKGILNASCKHPHFLHAHICQSEESLRILLLSESLGNAERYFVKCIKFYNLVNFLTLNFCNLS